jgi:hypothetical protein
MKHARLIGYIVMTIMGTGKLVASSPIEKNWQTISLSNLKDGDVENFCHGKLKDSIIECSEGSFIPLKLTVKGEYLSLSNDSSDLKVMKTCYVRCEEMGKFLFSSDLEEWKEFGEFFTGSINVAIEQHDEVAMIGLEVELNKRS